MKYLNASDGYITVSCEKCGQIIKNHKNYCTQYGNEYHFNPPISCSCGNTERVAYNKVMDNPDTATPLSIPLTAQEVGKQLLEAHINSLSRTEKIVLAARSVTIDGVKEGIFRRLPGYKMGKYEGKKEGYTEASKIYEGKLLKQARSFEEDEVSIKENYEEFKNLLDEYEKYIRKCEAEIEQLSEEQQKRVEELKNHYERLLKKNFYSEENKYE